MSLKPEFTQNAEHVLDELLVGGPVKTRSVNLTENQAQGALTRGAVLGFDGTDYARVHQTGAFGAATARAVLAEDADPSGGDVQALVYEAADINEDAVSLGGTVTADQVRESLRGLGIFLKKPVSR